MRNRITRTTNRLRLLAAGSAVAGLLAIAPVIEAQAPARDSARAGQRMPRGPQGARQGPMNPEQRVERRISHLTERLTLSEPQVTRIRQILTEEHEQVARVMEQAGMSRPAGVRAEGERPARPSEAEREAMRAKMLAVRTRTDSIRTRSEERIESVLTAQQRTTYRELPKEMRNTRGPRGEGRPAAAGMHRQRPGSAR